MVNWQQRRNRELRSATVHGMRGDEADRSSGINYLFVYPVVSQVCPQLSLSEETWLVGLMLMEDSQPT